MSYGYPIVLWSDKVARSQMQECTFYIKITGALTFAPLNLINNPILIGNAAAGMTQVIVEAFLGHTSSAVNATIFDATSLGTDTIGFVIDMAGQVDIVYGYTAKVIQTAGGVPANADVLVQATQAALGSANTNAIATYDGDLYGRIVAGNLDSATAGYIQLKVLFKSK